MKYCIAHCYRNLKSGTDDRKASQREEWLLMPTDVRVKECDLLGSISVLHSCVLELICCFQRGLYCHVTYIGCLAE